MRYQEQCAGQIEDVVVFLSETQRSRPGNKRWELHTEKHGIVVTKPGASINWQLSVDDFAGYSCIIRINNKNQAYDVELI